MTPISLRLFITFLAFAPIMGFGQDDVKPVTEVVIIGNRVTKARIILREISDPVGQPYDSLQAATDRNRLYNLGIFESVEIYPGTSGADSAVVMVDVRETLRVLPIPLLYRLEEVGWSYGGAVNVINFRGLNQRLGLSATIGAEDTYNFSFFDPWIVGEQISLSTSASRRFYPHPVYDTRTEESRFGFGVGKFTLDKNWVGRASFTAIERDAQWQSEEIGPTPPNGDRTRLQHRNSSLRLELHWRTMDIWRDPTSGHRVYLQFTPYRGADSQSPDYRFIRFDMVKYQKIRGDEKPTVVAWGATLSSYGGDVPYYLEQYLGGRWVRGYSLNPSRAPSELADRMAAQSLLATSFEVRQTLISRRLLFLSEWGLSGLIFFDAAWGFGNDSPLSNAQPLTGLGVGLSLFMPYLDNFGADIGINTVNGKPYIRYRLGHKF